MATAWRREGGVQRAAEVELLDDAVDHGDGEHDGQRPEAGRGRAAVDGLAQHRDAGDDERADEEEREQQRAEREGLHDRPGLRSPRRVWPRPRCSGPGRSAPTRQTAARASVAA